MWQIEIYTKENGKAQLSDFVKQIGERLNAKMIQVIDLLERFGNKLKEPFVKYIKDGIFELRIKAGTDIARVFYFFTKGNKIILTNGFIKKTQKMPQSEFDTAVKYKKDYERRNNNEVQ